MKILKFLVTATLALTLCGCQKADTAPVADVSPSTETSSSSTEFTPAETAPKKSSLDPVKEGDNFVFTDPSYGYSIKFPEDFHFNASEELQQKLAEDLKNDTNLEISKSVGLRFFIFRYEPETVPFNPNLNCTVEQVSPAAGELTTKTYTEFAREQLKTQLKATFAGESVPVDVNGTEFYRTDYQFVLPGADLSLKARVYSYYDPSSRVAYGFTIGAKQDDTSDDLEELDQVFQSLTMPK